MFNQTKFPNEDLKAMFATFALFDAYTTRTADGRCHHSVRLTGCEAHRNWNIAHRVCGLVLVVSLLIVGFPINALASCAGGRAATYDDITDIAVKSCGIEPEKYLFGVSRNGSMWLAYSAGKGPLGLYSANDGNPLFGELVTVLKAQNFFSIRLKPAPTYYIDGPCYTVEVMRCGVATGIGTLRVDMLPFEADLKYYDTKQFLMLARDMQSRILAWPWVKEHKDAPPSPSPIKTP